MGEWAYKHVCIYSVMCICDVYIYKDFKLIVRPIDTKSDSIK